MASQDLFEPDTACASPLSTDEVFDVLSNQRRRYVVAELRDEGDLTELGPLAERVAARENEVSVPEVTHAQRKRVYTALQQSHLPKMDDLGVVEFDKDRGLVDPTPRLPQVRTHLETRRGGTNPCLLYAFLISTLGAVLLLGVKLGVWPMTALPGVTAATVFLCSCSACVCLHWWYSGTISFEGATSVPLLGERN
jgi:hypothetical protein